MTLSRLLFCGRRRDRGKEHEIPDENNPGWRHESKFLLSVSDAVVIRARIEAVAERDSHAVDGYYWVRSLYFDNYRDKALLEKLNGTDPREKFRIRYYNFDTSRLYLEKKYRSSSLSMKFSEEISANTAQDILRGQMDRPLETNAGGRELVAPLLAELYSKMRFNGLRPVSVVDYAREPYVFEAGNVRVTFDHDLRRGWTLEEFLNPDCETIPASYPLTMTRCSLAGNETIEPAIQYLDRTDVPGGSQPVLMEVKWDHFLPEVIQQAIGMPCLPVTAFSKYAYTRAFR